jgi:hypothetical protein
MSDFAVFCCLLSTVVVVDFGALVVSIIRAL